MTRSRATTGSWRLAAVPAAGLLVGSLTFAVTGTPGDGPALPPSSAVAPARSATPPSAVSGVAPVRALVPTASPVLPASLGRVRIPAIAADSVVVPVGVDDSGGMALPADPGTAGWYRYGPAPGGGTGSVVLAAHVDDERTAGPWARLRTLRPGDPVAVEVTAGAWGRGVDVLIYRVVSVEQTEKATLDLGRLFVRTGPERLHLVTCGGRFDRRTGHYEDNVVVTAMPVVSG